MKQASVLQLKIGKCSSQYQLINIFGNSFQCHRIRFSMISPTEKNAFGESYVRQNIQRQAQCMLLIGVGDIN